ncbi:hypothetical protein H4R18_005905 [Coemansia javaensis]|uniref:PAS domain-containing protein n=1 Tax=Coemansia javaensis TaxID=2761396 RepID=A0A9W8LE67_9FUNG|nr:hypothetical protein H4R18_005905 [Coemansia javaensis]
MHNSPAQSAQEAPGTAADVQQVARPERPSYIGIHTRDESTQILYVSSGCRQGVGFTPEYCMRQKAKDFIIEEFNNDDYAKIYDSKTGKNAQMLEDEADDDDGSAYVMYVNLRTASGVPVLTRVTSFKCDNCVLYVNMAFPEAPPSSRHELEVQMLDGAMKKVNITRENERRMTTRRRQQAQAPGTRVPLYYSRSKQVKAALVLENASMAALDAAGADRRSVGPLVVFVTGSISRLIDADTSDVMREPFLKLVAPEDVLHVSKFFDRLAASSDVLFENFSLLNRPHLIDGDIVVPDEDNTRVVVECLGAAVQDGVALLLRRLKIAPPPKRDTMGNYIHSRIHAADDEDGYVSLAEVISSDPETSDAPSWSIFR